MIFRGKRACVQNVMGVSKEIINVKKKEIESREKSVNENVNENVNERSATERSVTAKNVDIMNVLKNSEKKKLNTSAKQLSMQK